MTLRWIVDARAPWPAIVDQGDHRSTCLSMAMTSAHDRLIGASLSAEYLHWASAKYPGGRGIVGAAQTAMQTDGQPPAIQWPYDPDADDSDAAYQPPTTTSGPFTTRAPGRFLSDIDDIISAMQQGSWPIVCLRVTNAFAARGSRVILSDGPGRAGHAVLAVAAGEVTTDQLMPHIARGERLIYLRNSWGPIWGKDGHKFITETALGECMYAAFDLG